VLHEGQKEEEKRISDKYELRKYLNQTKTDFYLDELKIASILKNDNAAQNLPDSIMGILKTLIKIETDNCDD